MEVLNSIQKTDFWTPHFTSIINWVLRCGLSILRSAKPSEKPWVAIIDASIGVGTKKILVVLRVPLDLLKRKKNTALVLEDTECVGVHISDSWNGESVQQKLIETFDQTGFPVAVLKDQGSDIKRGIKLLSESKNIPIETIEDVGHVASNALKAEFSELDSFKDFMGSVNMIRNQIRQSRVSFLSPPKLRSHSRFMSIGRLAKWGKRILEVSEKAKKNNDTKLSEIMNLYFSGVELCGEFLGRFISTCEGVDSFLKIAKTEGIGKLNTRKLKLVLSKMPYKSKTRLELRNWLKRHEKIRSKLAKKTGDHLLNLMVSTDVLESLFGKFKQVIFRCPNKEYGKSVLVIPLLCGKLDYETVRKHISSTSQNDLKIWKDSAVKTTQLQLKMRFHAGKLRGEMVPDSRKNFPEEPP